MKRIYENDLMEDDISDEKIQSRRSLALRRTLELRQEFRKRFKEDLPKDLYPRRTDIMEEFIKRQNKEALERQEQQMRTPVKIRPEEVPVMDTPGPNFFQTPGREEEFESAEEEVDYLNRSSKPSILAD